MDIKQILRDVQNGAISIEEAETKLKFKPFDDELTYATIDYHRELRNGCPEVIYCEHKALEHMHGIVENMKKNGAQNILGTRAGEDVYEVVKKIYPEAKYYPMARVFAIEKNPFPKNKGTVLIATGGTTDVPVAEEAAVTAEFLGNNVTRLYDVGVAGLHRLLSKLDHLKQASVIIVVAGMEGALSSVVGGLTDKPVIAVPTSIGYGTSFHGVSALLTMLNSCSSGVGVVNIDNGFGAAYLAHFINRLGG